ncbi:hypothetical protein NDU88_001742 [Pleurodeles waltl]|uniref:Uncharacterized protein n=1 Tax=Pleurodeles waltl TaxID=8319 RepID=A0AAV7NF55_PLEWA|nr:hypothetical protein NDU88_001742 [Pleurodeles waltl]
MLQLQPARFVSQGALNTQPRAASRGLLGTRVALGAACWSEGLKQSQPETELAGSRASQSHGNLIQAAEQPDSLAAGGLSASLCRSRAAEAARLPFISPTSPSDPFCTTTVAHP